MNKSFIGKKLLSLLLSVLMCLSLIPTVAFATIAEGETATVAKIGDTEYDTLEAAITAANNGDTITLGTGNFSTYGKVSTNKSLTFVGQGKDTVWTIGDLTKDVKAEGNGDYTFDGADTITFKNMTLKSDGADYRGFIRINHTVVDGCFLEGKTAFWGYGKAEFLNSTFNAPEGDYALWDYSSKEMSFDGCEFNISGKGVNVYVEPKNADTVARKVSMNDCTVNSTKANKAFLNIKNSTQAYDVVISGTNTVTGLAADEKTGSDLYQVENNTITATAGKPVKVQEKKIVDGKEVITTIYEVKVPSADPVVAKIGDTEYKTLQAAIDAAKSKETVMLVSNTRENVSIAKRLTLDLNGYTLNGGTERGKAALYINNNSVTVKDSSESQTGTIMREDTAENSGISSYYVIDIQGENGFLNFMAGNVKNDSGIVGVKGASLVRVGNDSVKASPVLTIRGGKFTQNNFIAIKVDRGTLHMLDGEVNSANSYAIENWWNANINGGTVNGGAASWTYSGGANSSLKITGGTINGNVTSVNYGNAEDKKATVSITGGTVTGELDTRSYDPETGELTGIDDAEKATIEVTGGTFSNEIPRDYCAAGLASSKNSDGTYTVKDITYVAEVGGVKYETVNAAIAAANNGDTVTLLSDTTEDVLINKSITLDLGGKTLTNTGAGKATITITGNNVTVKNGNVIGGASYYNIEVKKGASATLEGVTATAGNTGSSMVDNWGTLTIKSGSYTGGLDVIKNEPGAALTISGGTFTLEKGTSKGFTGVIFNYGKLEISGGTFIQGAKSAPYGQAQVIHTDKSGSSSPSTVITGGTFKNLCTRSTAWTVRVTNAAAGSTKVSGGTFNKKISDGYCANGYIPTKNADGTYGVKEGKYVAEVYGDNYETLEEAYANADDGDTITLLADCSSDRINLEDKSITLVLNGYTVTSTAAYGVLFCAKNGNTITIDGTAAGSKVVGTIMITNNTYGHIVINGGTYESALYCPIYVNGAVSNDESTVTITNAVITALRGNSDQDNGVAVYLAGYATSKFTNCTISAPVTGIEIRAGKLDLINCNVTGGSGEIMTSANGNGSTVANAAVAVSQHNTKKAIELNITGGTYTGTAAVYQTNVQGTGSDGVKVNISSGTFNGLVKAETTNVMAISGGTFDCAVLKYYCANEFAPVKNEDGKYEVIKLNVIKQLKLGNDLTMSYSVDSEGYTVSHVTFSIYDATLNNNQGGYTAPKTVYIKDGSFDFTGINPQRMVDTIKAVVYLVKDGKTYTYIVEDYSVKDYCLSLLNDPNYNVKWSEIISNLLVYGAEAQKYMNYRTDTLVTDYFKDCAAFKKVSHEDKMDSAIRYNEAVGGNGDITISSKLLVLDNAVNVRVYFNLKDGIEINNVKFTAAVIQGNEEKHPEEFTSFKQDANGYYFEYTGVMATELDNKIIFKSTINDAENVILNYNVNSYLVWAKNDAKLGALVKALFSYGYTCDHFAS